MDCPKCHNTMTEIDDAAFSAMKCTGCNGIWFKDGSHEVAKSIEGASAIDTSETNSAAAYNALRDIDCPECQQKMIKMTDRTQLHIEFEACRYCNGVFFDAGEFQDYSDFTVKERIKQAIDTLKANLST